MTLKFSFEMNLKFWLFGAGYNVGIFTVGIGPLFLFVERV